MKFYNREKESDALARIESISKDFAQMTVISGRRRIGKTALIKHYSKSIPFVYFFVGRKSEAMLCQELTEIISETLDEELGDFTSFSKLFAAIMSISKRKNFTLVFDEFQNISGVNPSFFSDMQNIWDSRKDESHINLILCGSIYSMMRKIFDDRHEPLFGRATNKLKIEPFTISTLKNIISEYNPDFKPDDLLAFYMISGGVAKYVEQMVMQSAFTNEKILDAVTQTGSYFIDEGRDVLSEEFGKEYSNYFSVMAAIASGKTTRGEITSHIGLESGGYLDKLEKEYNLVSRQRPYLQGENTRNVRYFINDNFLNFWFRFIYKYRSAIEIGNFGYVRDKISADYETYSGFILERYFRQVYMESGFYSTVSNYWNRSGKDEIDLIAVNQNEKQIVIAECKRNPQRIDIDILKEKSNAILNAHKKWDTQFIGLSLDDM
ncbi:MAG: ATP-binding protein [bacterium]|nr:ATP-binding protein [Candidatus Limimorpha equi]